MKEYKQVLPLIILIPFLVMFTTDMEGMLSGWLGIVVVLVALITVFEIVDKSRLKRISKWGEKRPSRLFHSIMFSFMIGVPTSLIILLIIHQRAELNHIIFLIIILLFGWIGNIDYNNCVKLHLANKYKVNL